MKRADVIIIGAGFAGASTAWWLKQMGVGRVILLEQEDLPGTHASGKNAGIARQAVAQTPIAILAARGVSFLRRPPEGFSETPLFEPTGGFLVSTAEGDSRLEAARKAALAAGVYTYLTERADVMEHAPLAHESPFRAALSCPYDGVVDIHALLAAYLASAKVVTGAGVTAFKSSKGRITGVQTTKGLYEADWFVNAAGAWVSPVGVLAGAAPITLTPKRRHLLHTGPWEKAASQTPYVWCLHPAVYFRPESHGLLLSPCDEAVWGAGTPPADPEAASWLAERLSSSFPHLANVPIARSWAELRTFSDDGLFVIGRDPLLSNFLWTAGLGGHGMTCSAGVGELAACLLLGRIPPVDPAPFDPARFIS